MPPSEEELFNRLKGRGTETIEQIYKRMERAREEMKLADEYDYIIVNENVENSVELLHNIVQLRRKELSGEE